MMLGWPAIAYAVLAATTALTSAGREQESIRLLDLDSRTVDPFDRHGSHSVVFIFARVDCPVSNRYAPELARLYRSFAPRGVEFTLIYPGNQPPDTIRRHLREYGYAFAALRDPEFAFVDRAGATVTPEAAVFDTRGTLRYLGRIDDRYISAGRMRRAATSHDLEEAIDAILAGKPVPTAQTPAVGCLIADLR
jgi:hypothetical protein